MQERNLFSGRRGMVLVPLIFCFVLALQGQTRTIQGGDGIVLAAPPVTAVHAITDDYHGTKIEDPYRWLEDAKSPETRAWIDAETSTHRAICRR